jgi:acetyl-CoA carboxylase carboxyl transferase subunit alpha
MLTALKKSLTDSIRLLSDIKPKELVERRYERLNSYGRFTDTAA